MEEDQGAYRGEDKVSFEISEMFGSQVEIIDAELGGHSESL